jgi:hypothetical protein
MKNSLILIGFCYLGGLSALRADPIEPGQAQQVFVMTQDYAGVTSRASQPEALALAGSCSSFYQVIKPLVTQWKNKCSSANSPDMPTNQTSERQGECDSLLSLLDDYRFNRSQPDGVLQVMPHSVGYELFLQHESREFNSPENSETVMELQRSRQVVAKTLGATLIDVQLIPGQDSLLKALKVHKSAAGTLAVNKPHEKIRIKDRLANCEILDGKSRLSATYKVRYRYQLGVQYQLVRHAWEIHQKLGELSRSGLPIYLKWVMYGVLVRQYVRDHHLEFSRKQALELSKPLLIEDQVQLVPKNLTYPSDLNSYYPVSVHKFSKVLKFEVEIIK